MPLNGSLNRTIQIGLKFNSTPFIRDVNQASDSLKVLERSAASAQGALDKTRPSQAAGPTAPGGGGAGAGDAMEGAEKVAGQVGSQIAAVGPMMSAALTAGLAPLTQIGSMVQGQMGLIGAVVAETATKMQNSMRLATLLPGLTTLQGKIKSAVASASTATTGSLTRLQQLTLALGPAAATAVGGYKGFIQVKTFLSALLGPVSIARQSLQKIGSMNLAAPGAGAATMTRQFRTMAPAVTKVTSSVKGLGLQIGMALGIVGGVYKATQALAGFFATGIKGAVTLGETMNKTKETFGESTGVVTGLADELAKKYGLVKGPILDAASSFGLVAKGVGYSTDSAAQLATQMTQLAADVSSFQNISMESALEKLRAGLTGESEPLKSIGVMMNEATVKAEALALGLTKGNQPLSENAKMQARASIITQKLATSSGDLERTQGAVANQFRKSGGGIENFATTIGTMLMPMVETSVVAFNELLATMIDVFETNKPMIQGWADTASQALLTVSDHAASAGDYFTIFKATTMQNLSNVLSYIELIPTNLGIVATYIAGNWRELIRDSVVAVATYFENLAKNAGALTRSIYEFLQNPTGGFNFNFTPLLDGFQATAAALPEMIKPSLVSMQDEIDAAGMRAANRTAGRVQARANAAMKLGGPARPEPIKEKPEKPKGSEYKGVAALELGSSEAGSAIARFLNQGGGTEARQTALNTKETAKNTKTTAQAIQQIANRAGVQPQGLATFTF